MRSEQEIRNLMLSTIKMGDASFAQGNLEKACQYYKMGLEKAHELCGQSEDMYDRAESLPLIYEKLGRTCHRLNRQIEAVTYYRNGLELRQNVLGMLYQKDWITGIKRRIAWDCLQLTSIYEESGDENNVARYCREGLPVSAELYNAYGTEEDGSTFITFAQRLGTFAYLSNNLGQAFQYFQDVLKVRKYLHHENGDERTREELATNYEFMGHIYYQKNDYENAADCYMKKLEIHQRMFEESPTVDNYGKCAWAYYHLSTALNDRGEYDCLQKAIGILEDIMDRFPQETEKYRQLGMQCLGKMQRFQR